MRHLPADEHGSFGIHLFTATENNAIVNVADDHSLPWGVPKMFYCVASCHTEFE